MLLIKLSNFVIAIIQQRRSKGLLKKKEKIILEFFLKVRKYAKFTYLCTLSGNCS